MNGYQIVNYDWPQIPLDEFVKRLEVTTGLKFRLDSVALEDAGIQKETLIDAKARNLPLRLALNLALSDVKGTELSDVIMDNRIIITSLEKSCEKYETILFNLGSFGITGEHLGEFSALLKRETTGPWDDDEPGTGTISLYPSRNSLIVRQTPRVQREILVLLLDLRSLPKDQLLFALPNATAYAVRTKYYSMAPETAVALEKLIPKTIAKGTWELELVNVTDSIQNHYKTELPVKDTANQKPELLPGRIAVVPVPERILGLQIIDLSLGQSPPMWIEETGRGKSGKPEKTTGECYLSITHNSEVHREVLKLLKALHRVKPPYSREGAGGGFFEVPTDNRQR